VIQILAGHAQQHPSRRWETVAEHSDEMYALLAPVGLHGWHPGRQPQSRPHEAAPRSFYKALDAWKADTRRRGARRAGRRR